MQQFTIFAFALLASAYFMSSVSADSLKFGSRLHGDHSCHKGGVAKAAKPLRHVEAEVKIEAKHGEKITYLELEDQDKHGHGATAQIVGGGLGSGYIKIHFKSQLGHSINYDIEAYSRKPQES